MHLVQLSLIREISALNRTTQLKFTTRVSVCGGSFLTSSSSSSSSTSRTPESCSSAWLPPWPTPSVDSGGSLLLRRPMKSLGFKETELSKERWSCAWKQKYTFINIITRTEGGALSLINLLWFLCSLQYFPKKEKKGQHVPLAQRPSRRIYSESLGLKPVVYRFTILRDIGNLINFTRALDDKEKYIKKKINNNNK